MVSIVELNMSIFNNKYSGPCIIISFFILLIWGILIHVMTVHHKLNGKQNFYWSMVYISCALLVSIYCFIYNLIKTCTRISEDTGYNMV